MGLIRYSCGHISGPHEPIPTKFGLWIFFIMLNQYMVSNMPKCKKSFFVMSWLLYSMSQVMWLMKHNKIFTLKVLFFDLTGTLSLWTIKERKDRKGDGGREGGREAGRQGGRQGTEGGRDSYLLMLLRVLYCLPAIPGSSLQELHSGWFWMKLSLLSTWWSVELQEKTKLWKSKFPFLTWRHNHSLSPTYWSTVCAMLKSGLDLP